MADGGGGQWLVQMEWHPAGWLMSAFVNLPLHHKVQKSSSGTGSPGWSRKKGHKMVVCLELSCHESCSMWDDLVVVAESKEELIKKLHRWKDGVEGKVMNVNMNKTKVKISEERRKWVQYTGRWPCGVCGRGVGRNSIQCTNYQKWVHRKCSGLMGSMIKVSKSLHIEAAQVNHLVSIGPVWILMIVLVTWQRS